MRRRPIWNKRNNSNVPHSPRMRRPATRQTRNVRQSDVQTGRLSKAVCDFAAQTFMAESRSTRLYPPTPSKIEKPPVTAVFFNPANQQVRQYQGYSTR